MKNECYKDTTYLYTCHFPILPEFAIKRTCHRFKNLHQTFRWGVKKSFIPTLYRTIVVLMMACRWRRQAKWSDSGEKGPTVSRVYAAGFSDPLLQVCSRAECVAIDREFITPCESMMGPGWVMVVFVSCTDRQFSPCEGRQVSMSSHAMDVAMRCLGVCNSLLTLRPF
jgi:hypothetical protein